MIRVVLDVGVAHGFDSLHPQRDVEPNVGIVFVAIVGPREEQALIKRFGDRGNCLAVGELLKDLGHLSFQKETIVENDVGVLEALDVAFRGGVEVRVDAGAHEAGDVDVFAADDLGNIGDLSDGGDDLKATVVVLGGCAAACRPRG